MHRITKSVVAGLFALSLGLGVTSAGFAEEAAEAKAPTTQPYPMTVCVVSGHELGGMGDPVVIQHEGREVRFCCAGCEPTFKKDPAKYIAKLDEAAKKAATTQPTEGDGHNHAH